MSEVASDGRREANGPFWTASQSVPPPPLQRMPARRPDDAAVRGAQGASLAPQDRTAAVAPSAQSRAKLAAGRHSRFVRRAKIWLPVLGLVILTVVIGRAYLLSHIPGIKMPAVLFSKNGLTMVEPRLSGRSRDRAYDFGAVRATQNYSSPKVVEFEQLSGRVELKDNGWAKVEARTGRYDGTSDGLTLSGHVTVTTSTGYLLNAQDAAIDLTKGNMSTDNPVHIDGPTGSIDAKAAQVSDSGNTILFSGGVHVTINPATVPASIGPTQPDPSFSANVPATAASQSTPIGSKP